MIRWLLHLVVFIVVLAFFKIFFGWNISIIGTLVLTIVFSLLSRLFTRR